MWSSTVGCVPIKLFRAKEDVKINVNAYTVISLIEILQSGFMALGNKR